MIKKALLNKNEFVKDGYNFIGWNTKETLDGKVYKNQEEVLNLTIVNNDTIDLYAM